MGQVERARSRPAESQDGWKEGSEDRGAAKVSWAEASDPRAPSPGSAGQHNKSAAPQDYQVTLRSASCNPIIIHVPLDSRPKTGSGRSKFSLRSLPRAVEPHVGTSRRPRLARRTPRLGGRSARSRLRFPKLWSERGGGGRRKSGAWRSSVSLHALRNSNV